MTTFTYEVGYGTVTWVPEVPEKPKSSFKEWSKAVSQDQKIDPKMTFRAPKELGSIITKNEVYKDLAEFFNPQYNKVHSDSHKASQFYTWLKSVYNRENLNKHFKHLVHVGYLDLRWDVADKKADQENTIKEVGTTIVAALPDTYLWILKFLSIDITRKNNGKTEVELWMPKKLKLDKGHYSGASVFVDESYHAVMINDDMYQQLTGLFPIFDTFSKDLVKYSREPALNLYYGMPVLSTPFMAKAMEYFFGKAYASAAYLKELTPTNVKALQSLYPNTKITHDEKYGFSLKVDLGDYPGSTVYLNQVTPGYPFTHWS